MRFGPGTDQEFQEAKEWGELEDMSAVLFLEKEDKKDGQLFESNSLSGGERHRLFLRRKGNYKEFSLVSGVDFREDGRGFSLFDVDGDGYLDMGITSPNNPRFRVMRNDLGDRLGEAKNKFVEISLVGGMDSNQPSSEWSPRDAYGSTVLVTIGDEQRMYHLSLGEGLSGQNSKRIHVGLGDKTKIDSIKVNWPSGKVTEVKSIAAGERITVHEKENKSD